MKKYIGLSILMASIVTIPIIFINNLNLKELAFYPSILTVAISLIINYFLISKYINNTKELMKLISSLFLFPTIIGTLIVTSIIAFSTNFQVFTSNSGNFTILILSFAILGIGTAFFINALLNLIFGIINIHFRKKESSSLPS